ncbi:MAG TPA: acyl-CoA dehydrogenase family protein [Blastocatellia bacterium]
MKVATDPSINASRRERPDPSGYREQIETVAVALEHALAQNNLAEFYKVFRATDLPFVGAVYEGDAYGLFQVCFDVLHRLGGLSPATALAVENHYYVSSAIATFPTAGDQARDSRRRSLLDSIIADRLLVANTNSKVHGGKLGEIGTRARREAGGFRVNGKAAYTSLATQGDLLVFITQIEGEGPAVFSITPMQGNPGVEIGDYLFPSAMLDSDTRQITFNNLFLPEEALLAGGDARHAALLFSFEMAWHQLLIPALYLGAAARAIEEARMFLRATRGRDERPLSELDGMIIDIGRLTIEYRSACCVVQQAGQALGEVMELPRDSQLLDRAVDLASAAKYVGTRCAEAVVTATRRIVGARAFVSGHHLERLSQEVMFASLGPEVSAVIERRYGKKVLDEHSFFDLHW